MAETTDTSSRDIDTLFLEERRYPPPPEFAAQANAQPDIYERGFEELWETEGRERVTWFEPFEKLYEWEPPYAKWYLGGKLNVCFNCVDRHVEAGNGERVAYHWEGEPLDDRRAITYADLQRDVVRFANGLKQIGVGRGTPVAIYMGMVPELPVAMLACTRLGAPHTVIFGGFSADSLSGRMNDMECEVLITQDEAWRRGSTVPLKRTADEAMADAPACRASVVLRRTGNDVPMQEGRDHWWHDLVDAESDDPASCPCEEMDSGTCSSSCTRAGRRRAEGHRPHDRRLPQRRGHDALLHLRPEARDRRLLVRRRHRLDHRPQLHRLRAAVQRRDVGALRGHARLPGQGPLVVDRRALWRDDPLHGADRDPHAHEVGAGVRAEARPLVAPPARVGRRADQPEAWIWYREHIGGDRTPIVDTWWQTETGTAMITPLPGVTTLKPGCATKPFPGVEAAIYNEAGEEVGPGGGGYLVLKRPWPAMLRGIFGDDARYRETYWSKYEGVYFAGDGARIDQDGDFWLLGRVDDVMNVSGHRISTIEVESALVDHQDVAEAAVCSRKDATTGEAIVAYVTLKSGNEGSLAMLEELRNHVGKKIGPIAKPANIVFTPELPKTRSGKIMRRLLRDVAENRPLGDTTTLADPTVVEEIKERATEEKEED